MLSPENGVWCAGGCDDNIRAITGLIELLKQNHLAVKFPRQLRRAFMGAIGYKDRSCPVGHQVARSQFAHLPCANEIDVSSLKRPENLLCQLDRNRGNRYCRRSYGGFRPDSLGNSKSPRQQQIKLRMDCTHRALGCICLFYLPQNLRLAYHHGIQTCRHAKQMTDGFALAIFIKMRLVLRRIELEILAQKPAQIGGAVLSLSQHLHTIAGTQDQTYIHAGMRCQSAHRDWQTRLGDRQQLPSLTRRAIVVHPDELKIHDWTNL